MCYALTITLLCYVEALDCEFLALTPKTNSSIKKVILGVHPNQLNSHPNPKLLEAIHKKYESGLQFLMILLLKRYFFVNCTHTEKSWEWSKAPFVPLNPFAKSVSFLMLCPFKNFLCLRF